MSFSENNRAHKERHQPAHRARRGLLEKKKDYRLRARDFKSKRARLQKLAEKAAFKNPDEFYFTMAKSKRENGVFKKMNNAEAGKKYTQQQLVNMKTQDLAYLNYKKSIETKKIETLHSGLHFLEEVDASRPTKRPRHTVFVDSDEELEDFSPASYFDTPEELLGRKFNRPTLDTLENGTMIENAGEVIGDPTDLKRKRVHSSQVLQVEDLEKMEKQRTRTYAELALRVQREAAIERATRKGEIQKHLMGKGTVKKRKRPGKAPVYQWTKERKK